MTRREAIYAQALAAEREIEAYLVNANDDARRLFEHPADMVKDVRAVFLKHNVVNPSYEDRWLEFAENQLRIGWEYFDRVRKQVETFGGPHKIQVIG